MDSVCLLRTRTRQTHRPTLEYSEHNSALDEWHDRIEGLISKPERDRSSPTSGEIASLVLVILQGFTVTAVNRPQDIPQPDELDAAIAALVRGLLDT